jgi:hypothetical protein
MKRYIVVQYFSDPRHWLLVDTEAAKVVCTAGSKEKMESLANDFNNQLSFNL